MSKTIDRKYVQKKILSFLEISLGVFLLDVGFYFFYTPTNLVTGGAMGLSIILKDVLPFSTSIFLYIFNIATLLLGLILLGKDFFMKTVYASLLSPTLLLVLELTCQSDFFTASITEGKLIITCLCGAILVSAGLGLCFRNNGCTGGMDVVQKIMSKYLHMPISKTMYFTDWIVVILGGFVFVGGVASYNIEYVTYGVIAVLLTGYLVDTISINGRSRRTAYIITKKPDEVKEFIYSHIERGVTLVSCKGGYTGEDKMMIICTLDKSESYMLSDFIKEIDKESFTFMTSTREVVGEYGDSK